MPIPVFAIVGSDVFLQLQAIAEIVRQMPADTQRVDVDNDADLAIVLDDLRSLSMFGGYKLVVMRDADDFISKHREALEGYFDKPGEAGSLVLRCVSLPKNQRIYKIIDKVGKVIACEPPKQVELAGWIMKRATQHHQSKIADDAARQLADLIGPDLGRLDNEIAKLALQSGGMIQSTHISTSVVFQREQEMWDLTDALTLGRPDEALRRWRHMIVADPSSEFRAVTWLGMWLEKAVKALAMKKLRMNAFTIAKELKIWPAQNADKLLVTVERLGESKLKRAIDRLVEVDQKNKSGVGAPATNVEQFLLSLA
jgi:DNA polymerase III subunit delta